MALTEDGKELKIRLAEQKKKDWRVDEDDISWLEIERRWRVCYPDNKSRLRYSQAVVALDT